MKVLTLSAFAVFVLSGCQATTTTLTPQPDDQMTNPIGIKKPTEQRMCTMQYDPVCGKIDNNGIISYKTFSNACTASFGGDNVISQTKGECGSEK